MTVQSSNQSSVLLTFAAQTAIGTVVLPAIFGGDARLSFAVSLGAAIFWAAHSEPRDNNLQDRLTIFAARGIAATATTMLVGAYALGLLKPKGDTA